MECLLTTELQAQGHGPEHLLRLHSCFLRQGIYLENGFPVIFTSSLIYQHKLSFLPSFLVFLTADTVGQLIHLESGIC